MKIIDAKATVVEGYEWRTQQAYLEEYNTLVTSLSAIAPAIPAMSRSSMARSLISRMVETVADRCAFSRGLLSLPEQAVFVVPEPEPELYVPRVCPYATVYSHVLLRIAVGIFAEVYFGRYHFVFLM